MSRRGKGKESNPEKFCDPAVCDCCVYVREGYFLCYEYVEIVVADWVPTENYLMCQTQRKAIGDGEHD